MEIGAAGEWRLSELPPLALGTYRRAVSVLIPEMTRIAWNLKKDELAASHQRMTVSKRQFVYNLSRASYRKE